MGLKAVAQYVLPDELGNCLSAKIGIMPFCATASPATPMCAFPVNIGGRVFVTVRAMGLKSLPAQSPSQVLPIIHRLKMIGVDAGAVAAQMIQLFIARDRAVSQFVSHPMGRPSSPPVEKSVPVTVQGRCPHPTRSSLFNMCPKTFFGRGRDKLASIIPAIWRPPTGFHSHIIGIGVEI